MFGERTRKLSSRENHLWFILSAPSLKIFGNYKFEIPSIYLLKLYLSTQEERCRKLSQMSATSFCATSLQFVRLSSIFNGSRLSPHTTKANSNGQHLLRSWAKSKQYEVNFWAQGNCQISLIYRIYTCRNKVSQK